MRKAKTKRGTAKSAQAKRRRSAPTSRARGADVAVRLRLDVDERRAQLVALGLTEFSTRSYDDVSIDLIAQTAGISKGLLYHYFPTKRAFYLACVREAAAHLLARIELPADVPPLERLKVGLDRYLEFVRAHGAAFATLMRSGASADRELADVVDATRGTLLTQLTSGMADVLQRSGTATPLLHIALEGWIGLAEAASIAWVEACVKAKSAPSPSSDEVRDLLAHALITIVQTVQSKHR